MKKTSGLIDDELADDPGRTGVGDGRVKGAILDALFAVAAAAVLGLLLMAYRTPSATERAAGTVTPVEVGPTGVSGTFVARLGVSVADDPRGGACVVTVPEPGSPAGLRGLRPDDRLTRLNTHPVTGAADLAARIDAATGPVALEVIDRQDGRAVTYDVAWPDRD